MEASELLSRAGTFDGTICGDDRYTAEVIQACAPRLKVISKWGTGIDSIDVEAAEAAGIVVGNTPGAFTEPVSDSALAYILGFCRRHYEMDQAMKEGRWAKFPGRALSECTVGVIGVGAIGQAVMRKCSAFNCKLLGYDPVSPPQKFIDDTGCEMTTLESLLRRSDFVTLHCQLTKSTHHLMDARRFSQMTRGAYLINTARGPVVHEAALCEVLQSGHLAGCALDVFEHEPLPIESPLRRCCNAIIAPHNSNSSPAAHERVHWNTIRNLLNGLGIEMAECAL